MKATKRCTVLILLLQREPEDWKPLVIIIPLRLGLETINEDYIPTIKQFFHFPQSLGIIGGKPRASLYFVAYQGIVTSDVHFALSIPSSCSSLGEDCRQQYIRPASNLHVWRIVLHR